ncbi:hypothetical protein GJ631_00935 [Natronomonas sp. CBA1123]|uniref:hypothetical protein n=1 Tax=Natronomonas sp. CBA1123 TaxID=2668070 RepID=UPI0012E9A35C|nr:hypothetical protein [Natronomonas sp. CBA1123]MUV85181.1 hypothetical protein [Natronomonas sp. CBA1123]
MLGKVKTILGRLQMGVADGVGNGWPQGHTSVSGHGGPPDDSTTEGSGVAQQPYLYSCSSCDQIYVATDKHTCSTCGTAVERVERTE